MATNEAAYGAWRIKPFVQRPTIGSRWYRGNFNLGLIIDSHPRFVNVIIGLLFVEIGIGFTRSVVIHADAMRAARTPTKGGE